MKWRPLGTPGPRWNLGGRRRDAVDNRRVLSPSNVYHHAVVSFKWSHIFLVKDKFKTLNWKTCETAWRWNHFGTFDLPVRNVNYGHKSVWLIFKNLWGKLKRRNENLCDHKVFTFEMCPGSRRLMHFCPFTQKAENSNNCSKDAGAFNSVTYLGNSHHQSPEYYKLFILT
jgi:hypothetical protein